MNELQDVLNDIDVTFRALTPEMELAEVRKRLEPLFGSGVLDPGCNHSRVSFGEAGGELITPHDAPAGGSAVLYLHGGGYCVCSIDTHRDLCERIAHEAGGQVLAVDYRLAPEHPFPAALDDALAGYQWLLDQGHATSNIAIAGDSAGGGLALATLLAIRDRDLPLPACGVVLSPWVDLTLSGGTMATLTDVDPIVDPEALAVWIACYVPDGNLRNPLVSPLFGDFSGLPPLLVQIAGRETLLDDARRITEVAEKAGVTVDYEFFPDQIHVFQVFGHRLAEARKAIAKIGAFIRRHAAVTAG